VEDSCGIIIIIIIIIILLLLLLLLLFTAIGFAPGGSSPTLVQTKTITQHYTVVQHNTIKRKQHNTIKRNVHNTIKSKHNTIKRKQYNTMKRKDTIIRTQYNKHTIIHKFSSSIRCWKIFEQLSDWWFLKRRSAQFLGCRTTVNQRHRNCVHFD
jgi:uncharacterized protein HemX